MPCHVAEGRSQLETALVGTGFSYRRENRVVQAAILAHLLPRIRDIRRVGSAALDLCWVANGRFDAYFESGTHYWDWAAGSVICQEAGGRIASLPGDIVLASTPQLLAPLTDLLAEAQDRVQAPASARTGPAPPSAPALTEQPPWRPQPNSGAATSS